MSELRELQNTLQASKDSQRLGTVESRLDAARIAVRFPSGVRRTVYGQAPVGAQVLVQGQQLVSRMDDVRSATMIIE